jgi:5'-nucleotidase
MQLVRPRSLSALLTVALGAGFLAGAGTLASPASAEGAAPTGAYALNTTAIWEKQYVLLTQTALADDVDAADAITREINWGDGTIETLKPGTTTTKLRHQYETAGTYTVLVNLTDSEGNTAAAEVTGTADVKVTTTAGTYKVDKKSAWTGKRWNKDFSLWWETPATLTMTLSGIPANATRVRITLGDGEEKLVPRTTKKVSLGYYAGHTPYRVTVSLENENGRSAEKFVGNFTVTHDRWAPAVSVTTPSKPAKASSWKTIKGKSTDKGLGTDVVRVSLVQERGTTLYYFNFTKKAWSKLPADGYIPNNSSGIKNVKVSRGAWSVSVAGMKKGYLTVVYAAKDKANNYTDWLYKQRNITS